MDIRKIKTENSLLDEVIYNLKLIMNTCVVKDTEKAHNNETDNSARNAGIWMMCVEGRAKFDLFRYTEDDLKNAGMPSYLIEKWREDKDSIPDKYRDILTKQKSDFYISNYIEENNYYRELMGIPNFGEEGIKLTSECISMMPDDIRIDYDLYVHQMDTDKIDLLYSLGVIDKLIEKYPDKLYLNHMGTRSIPLVIARSAKKFGLLYVTGEAQEAVVTRFKDKYERARVYTLRTIYSDAYKYNSDYYDQYIMVLIMVQTFIDMLAEIPDYLIKKDIFDIRTARDIFKSNGIDYYSNIPLRYQLAMVRNVNRLIKFKSTSQSIVDICSLFGFDNIEIFKYYLLKEHKRDRDGNYLFNKDENGKLIDEENYDLKFIKVPMDELVDDNIFDQSLLLDYDEITANDKYWDSNRAHELVKRKILDHQFNYVRSKYMSLNTVYDMTELSFQLSYFYNILFDEEKYTEYLTLTVPKIGDDEFKLADLLCYLFALGYQVRGIEDTIMDTTGKVLHVCGFNFDADLEELNNYILEKGFTSEDLGIDDFQVVKGQILTFNQLVEIFVKNKKVYKHVVNEMINADDARIYHIYEKIYDALFITDFNNNFFRKSDGTMCKTYTEFLSERNKTLYDSLISIKYMSDKDERNEKINDIITSAVYALEEYFVGDDFNFIFSELPAVSSEAVKQYLYQIISFFKSYKIDFYSLGTIYIFDDKLDNKITCIDDILINYLYNFRTILDITDKEFITAILHPAEYSKDKDINGIGIRDAIELYIKRVIDKFFIENIEDTIYDDITYILSKLQKGDKIIPVDEIRIERKNV